jgi:hypothetical protein
VEFLKIAALGVISAICYGVLHDQVTARVCVEYFTVGHQRLIDSDSPTVLGFFWGVVATFGLGLLLGTVLASAARLGSRRPLFARDLLRPIGKLLLVMYGCAILAGLLGFTLAQLGHLELPSELARRVPADHHSRFFADWFAHLASYASGIIGVIVLSVQTFRTRRVTVSKQTS